MPLFHCGSGSSIYNGTAVALLRCCFTLGSKRQRKCRDTNTHIHTQIQQRLITEPGFPMYHEEMLSGWMNVLKFVEVLLLRLEKGTICWQPLKRGRGWLLVFLFYRFIFPQYLVKYLVDSGRGYDDTAVGPWLSTCSCFLPSVMLCRHLHTTDGKCNWYQVLSTNLNVTDFSSYWKHNMNGT